jgi:hypothetical protein
LFTQIVLHDALLAVTGGSAIGLSATDARVEPLPVIKVNVWAFLYVPGTKAIRMSMPAAPVALAVNM